MLIRNWILIYSAKNEYSIIEELMCAEYVRALKVPTRKKIG